MRNESISHVLLRLGLYFLIIEGGLSLLTGIFCWLIGWRSFYQFGVTLATLGMLVGALGALGVAGGWGGTRNFEYQYGSSASSRSLSERARQDLKDLLSSYRFAYLTFAAGGVTFLVGLAIADVL